MTLAKEGRRRIEWAEREMPVLNLIRQRFEKEQPLRGLRLVACAHVTTETANLVRTLQAGGADSLLIASNPLSTRMMLQRRSWSIGGPRVCHQGGDTETYNSHVRTALDSRPEIL